jgi:hypothetical protein
MENALHSMCGAAVPGDTYRNLRISPIYTGRTFKHILVPVWLLTYDYHGKTFRTVANGVTGTVAGRYPKSAWKIFFLVLAIVLAVLTVFILV